MILVLQTNVDHTSALWLLEGNRVMIAKHEVVDFPQRTSPLVQLDSALRAVNKTPRDIRRIIVTRGPGRFSAVRTGLLIANTLSQELGIPVQGIVKKTLFTETEVVAVAKKYAQVTSLTPVKPWYGKKPNITKPSAHPAKSHSITKKKR